jgi:RNA polymerase sigma-70 factor (ECF subfamily)
VKRFLANEYDRRCALKRGGGEIPVSMDLINAEAWYAPASAKGDTPEGIFERRWAVSLLERAMTKLRVEFITAGKAEQFDSLAAHITKDADAARYDAMAAEMGVSAGALRTLVHRMRRRYRDLVRAEIAETVAGPEEIDGEVRFLMAVLSAQR